MTGSGKSSCPDVGGGRRRRQRDGAGEIGLLHAPDRAQVAQRHTAALIIAGDLFHRAMQIDRCVVAGFSQQRDHALCLAERIGADQMRALRKQRHRGQKFFHLVRRAAVAKHRQAKSGLGDEDVAGHHLERRAGRVGRILVVTGGDDADASVSHRDLRRAQHMACGMKFDGDVAESYRFAIANGLRRAGEMVAVTQPHHVERLLRRQHRAMARPRVVGMAVGNDGALDRPHRIDMEAAGFAAQAGGDGHQDVLRTHFGYIGRAAAIFTSPRPGELSPRTEYGADARATVPVLRRSGCRPPV